MSQNDAKPRASNMSNNEACSSSGLPKKYSVVRKSIAELINDLYVYAHITLDLFVPGGGDTLIFSYIGSGHFLPFKILISIFFWFSEKLIFFEPSQNWTSFRVISMYLRVYSKVHVQNWDIFGVAKMSNIFWGA